MTFWLERQGYFQNLIRHNLVNKQLQYTNHPISHEVKSQTMKLKKYFCAKNYAENEAGRLLPDPFLLFQKRFIWPKNKCSWFQFFLTALNLAYINNKLHKTVDYSSWDKLFLFFWKTSGNSFSIKFCVWFLKKNVSNVILSDHISLSDYLYFLRYWAICVL